MSQTITLLARELREHPPFQQLPVSAAEAFAAAAVLRYHEDQSIVLSPQGGVANEILWIKQGLIRAEPSEQAGLTSEHERGDWLPVAAFLAKRPVRRTYRAVGDVFVLAIPGATLHAIVAVHPSLMDWMNRRLMALLDLSTTRLRERTASDSLALQSMETPLGRLVQRPPVLVRPDESIRHALEQMRDQGVGSVLVGESHVAIGILSRHDLLERITLPGVALDAPVRSVMSSPLVHLDASMSAMDAAVAMAKHGIRHIPVVSAGQVVGMVSERDLFKLQSQSVGQLSSSIRRAADLPTLTSLAAGVRTLTQNLLAQGLRSHQLTALVSHLNDLLTQQTIRMAANQHGLSMDSFSWLAFGSEGRSEQTLATDQDNGLTCTEPGLLPALKAMAADANRWLDALGFPLCRGGVMAMHDAYAHTQSGWLQAFRQWVDHGTPQDLLSASICFDSRGLVGRSDLADALAAEPAAWCAQAPRFMKLLALQALSHTPPLSWTGRLETRPGPEGPGIDLKLQGSALFVDAARVLALSQGIALRSTRDRLSAAAQALHVPEGESSAWITAFDFIQTLRLRQQLKAARTDHANWLTVDTLDAVDHRVLRESLKMAGRLQQRLRLDYER
jgi:CBS domain-containing protein